MRRLVPMLLAVPVLLVLAGCTPVGMFLGDGAEPTEPPTPAATPSASPTPTPATGGCDDAVLTDPGEYHLPDCLKVTVQGHDIQVNAGAIQTLLIEGDGNDVNAGVVGSLRVRGSVNDVDTLEASSVELAGNFNQIGVHGSVGRVAVDGNDNDVLADGDVGAVEDRGERNVVGSQP